MSTRSVPAARSVAPPPIINFPSQLRDLIYEKKWLVKPCFNYANPQLTSTNIGIQAHEFLLPLRLEIDWLLALSKGKIILVKFFVLLLPALQELDKVFRIAVVTVRPCKHTLVFAQ